MGGGCGGIFCDENKINVMKQLEFHVISYYFLKQKQNKLHKIN